MVLASAIGLLPLIQLPVTAKSSLSMPHSTSIDNRADTATGVARIVVVGITIVVSISEVSRVGEKSEANLWSNVYSSIDL